MADRLLLILVHFLAGLSLGLLVGWLYYWLRGRAEARAMRRRIRAGLEAIQRDPDAWRGVQEANRRRLLQ